MRPPPILAFAMILAGRTVTADSPSPTPVPENDRVTASGSLAWVLADDLDLVGDLRADLPFLATAEREFHFSLATRTAIDSSFSNVNFKVRELLYTVEVGARWHRETHRGLSIMAGQWGKEIVDADGQPYVQYVGLGLESAENRGFERSRPLAWRVAIGPVVGRREVEADGFVRGEAHFGRPVRQGSLVLVGADLMMDALLGGSGTKADVILGPRLDLGLRDERTISLFAHYLRGHNPLGLEVRAILAGFEFAEGPHHGAPRVSPPDVSGLVASGAGDGRLTGRFLFRVESKPAARRYVLAAEVDANLLTGEETGELYYTYDIGIERHSHASRAGIYFYHRSNHQLAEPNAVVTIMNTLAIGIETSGWSRPGGSSLSGRWGCLDGRLRAGPVLESSFGDDRRWQVRLGLRWTLPMPAASLRPFLSAEAEVGDTNRRAYALGIVLRRNAELALEYESDTQFFGSDKTAIVLLATSRF